MWEHRIMSVRLFIALSAFATIGFLLTAVFFVFNIKYRNLRLVRMSSPNLNVVITAGGLLSYICCALYGLDAVLEEDLNAMTVTCQARSYLLTLSVTLVFGAMLTKSWRVYMIFRKAGTQRVIIKDQKLLLILAAFVCADVIVLSLWHVIDPLQAEHTPVVLWEESLAANVSWRTVSVTECSSKYTTLWLSILSCYKAGLLTAGGCLSWATRHVLLPSMNEARFTILTTFTTTILCSIAAALSVILRASPDTAQACLAGAVWMSTTATLSLVFVPKMLLVLRRVKTKIIRHSMKFSSASDMPQLPDHVQDRLFRLRSENHLLKKSLVERDDAIQSLQEHLGSAQTKLEQLSEEEDVRSDSGLDCDMSSAASSQDVGPGDDIHQVKPQDEDKTAQTVDRESPNKHHTTIGLPGMFEDRNTNSLNRNASLRKVDKRIRSGRLVMLRHSIAEDLQHAHELTFTLRESAVKKFNQPLYKLSNSASGLAEITALPPNGLDESVSQTVTGYSDFNIHNTNRATNLPRQLQHRIKQEATTDRALPHTDISPKLCEKSDTVIKPRKALVGRQSRTCKFQHASMTTRGSKMTESSREVRNVQQVIASCLVEKQYLRTAKGTVCLEVLDFV